MVQLEFGNTTYKQTKILFKDNFKEVYAYLKQIKLSTISSDPLKLEKKIRSKISQKISNQLQKKIINIGDNILINNLNLIF